jgi:hypothetical protein
MSTHLDFCISRAEQARSDADAATLDNVRDRCRRSEAAWTELAERAQRTERLRAASEKQKAEAMAEPEMQIEVS